MIKLTIKVGDDILVSILSQSEVDNFYKDFDDEGDFLTMPIHNNKYNHNITINKMQIVYYYFSEV